MSQEEGEPLYVANTAMWWRLSEKLSANVWAWCPAGAGREGTSDELTRLKQETGWTEFDDKFFSTPLFFLWGQLSPTMRFHLPGEFEYRILAQKSDLERIERTPVILAFQLPQEELARLSPQARSLYTSEQTPPPTLGQIAIVLSKDGLQARSLDHLGERGKAAWEQMSAALQTYAAPNTWEGRISKDEIELWEAAAAPSRYEQLYQELQAQQTEASQLKLSRLVAIKKQTDRRTEAKRRREENHEASTAMWKEIQEMAHQLAELYWQAEEQDQTEQAAILPIPIQGKQARRQHIPKAAMVIKNPKAVKLPSNLVTQEFLRHLLDPSPYKLYEDAEKAESSVLFGKNHGQVSGELTITIQPGEGEVWQHVLASLNNLGDEIVDTYCALLALAIDTNGVTNITSPFYISPDDILHICQRKQSHGSFTLGQRAVIIEHLYTLTRIHVKVIMSVRRGREHRQDSPTLSFLGDTIGEFETITGEAIWQRRRVALGDWMRLIPPLDEQTAVLLRQVLQYHSVRERYAKRLGRYLTLQFRINFNKRGGTVKCSMGVLCKQSGITPDRNTPGRTRDMIEAALAKLKKDGVIGSYGPIVESLPPESQQRVTEQAYGWWEEYEKQQWLIEPPASVREIYGKMRHREIEA
jgi:hypothetical protein